MNDRRGFFARLFAFFGVTVVTAEINSPLWLGERMASSILVHSLPPGDYEVRMRVLIVKPTQPGGAAAFVREVEAIGVE